MNPPAIEGFWLSARRDPGRIALVDPEGREHRAGELGAAANRLVHGLRARGLRAGDCVATLMPNGAALIEVMLAAFQAGWHYTAINSHLTSGEVAYILSDSGAKAFFSHERHAPVARAAAETSGLLGGGAFGVGTVPGFERFEALQEGQPDSLPPERLSGQFMQYTSGTTGRPKAVRRQIPPMDAETGARLLAANLAPFGIEPGGDHVHLVTSPMYHMAPLSYGFFSLHYDHKVVLMEKWDAERALQLIEQHRVTTTHMVPTQFHRLMLLPEEVRKRYDCSSLRHVLHAAAPCPVELKRRLFEWWGPVIYEYYGATEGGGTLATPHDWLRHPGTVGRPWEGADIKIFDDDGNELPPGKIGTVYLKLMGDFEYKGDPAKTRASRRGAYFTAGDVGELNAEGFLFLRDRKIDMIISGGVNIYPAEVEAVLLAHPAVGDAAVFGIPHEDWGEEVKAVVELAPGFAPGAPLARELLEHCQKQLARYKCPRSVDFTEALPRDPNGKLYKRKLRDPYWAGRERQI
jgi:long-chain acyl-CoA synthetase